MTLKELKKELKNMTIPNQLTIGAKNFNNVQKTIDSHIRYLEANKGNKAFMPYWYNLLEIYNFIIAQPKKK